MHTSQDAGQNWAAAGGIDTVPAPITAHRGADSRFEVWIADNDGTVLHSTDSGQIFDPLNT